MCRMKSLLGSEFKFLLEKKFLYFRFLILLPLCDLNLRDQFLNKTYQIHANAINSYQKTNIFDQIIFQAFHD